MIMPIVYRWLMMAAVFAAALGFGFVKGISYEQGNQAKKEVAQLVTIIHKERAVQAVSDKVGTEVQAKKEKVRTVYRDVDKEIIKYVQVNNESATAIADAEWVRIFNASALGCKLTEPACGADAEVSGVVTRADAIETIRQQHEIYQQCRVTVNGWQDFYIKVREQLNDNTGTTTSSDSKAK